MCCEPISLLHSSRALSCEQKLCEPISLLHFSRALSCEQKLCEPISLSPPHLSLAHRLTSSLLSSQRRCKVASLYAALYIGNLVHLKFASVLMFLTKSHQIRVNIMLCKWKRRQGHESFCQWLDSIFLPKLLILLIQFIQNCLCPALHTVLRCYC